MSGGGTSGSDPGPTPTSARSLAPDLARGGMLLLVALANVQVYVFSRPEGVRGYPAGPAGADQVVVLLQMLVVDGRAYPMFALLFGYGVTQLARARPGARPTDLRRLVGRRGGWLVAIGLVHGMLLWSGDIVGAYGLVAVLLAGVLVAGSDRGLLAVAAGGIGLTGLLSAASGIPPPPGTVAALASMTTADPLGAALARAVEWSVNGLVLQAVAVFGAVALGAWAARRRMLDDPARHRRLLVRVAVAGTVGGVGLGVPFALLAAGVWTDQPLALRLVGSALHGFGGFAAGTGYAALFGLLAIRPVARGRAGPVVGALVACGRRSLSCYLAQSVAFVALLPAWTLSLGATATLWQAGLLAVGNWTAILLAAVGSERVGYRGPAEILLRRLTYGRGGAIRAPASGS